MRTDRTHRAYRRWQWLTSTPRSRPIPRLRLWCATSRASTMSRWVVLCCGVYMFGKRRRKLNHTMKLQATLKNCNRFKKRSHIRFSICSPPMAWCTCARGGSPTVCRRIFRFICPFSVKRWQSEFCSFIYFYFLNCFCTCGRVKLSFMRDLKPSWPFLGFFFSLYGCMAVSSMTMLSHLVDNAITFSRAHWVGLCMFVRIVYFFPLLVLLCSSLMQCVLILLFFFFSLQPGCRRAGSSAALTTHSARERRHWPFRVRLVASCHCWAHLGACGVCVCFFKCIWF